MRERHAGAIIAQCNKSIIGLRNMQMSYSYANELQRKFKGQFHNG